MKWETFIEWRTIGMNKRSVINVNVDVSQMAVSHLSVVVQGRDATARIKKVK
jgi:hypothetical protein